MDGILALLNESRQSTLFPLFQCAALAVGFVGPLAVFGMAICRDEVKAALRMADISHKEAAITMGVCPALLSRKLSGDKPLTFESLQKLPPAFWQWFFLLGAQRHGLPSVIQTGAAVYQHNETVGAL
jgi:hypothetical protein